jgi:hypothetical protein
VIDAVIDAGPTLQGFLPMLLADLGGAGLGMPSMGDLSLQLNAGAIAPETKSARLA